jgi:enoyl-CoA hydratase/carnithine racemase
VSSDTILLDVDGPVAVMTNNRPDRHNAANNEMDARLWEILRELHERPDVRAVVWRGNGKSFSSGRDVAELGQREPGVSDLEFI